MLFTAISTIRDTCPKFCMLPTGLPASRETNSGVASSSGVSTTHDVVNRKPFVDRGKKVKLTKGQT